MARVLIVDDDASLVKLLSEYLARLGYDIASAFDGAEAVAAHRDNPADLVLLDIRMPNFDGWQTLESLREMSKVPVIALTALCDEPDVLRGFALGADDYVSKPFSFAQLAARIEAILKRTASGDTQDILRCGDLVLDLGHHRVYRGGVPIRLTPTEFKLLAALMEQPGTILTPRKLVIQAWGEECAEDTEYVRRYIWHLRRKIEPDCKSSKYIHNERGIGYCVGAPSEDTEQLGPGLSAGV